MKGRVGVLAALAVLALSGAAEACPMCKEALFDLKEAAQRVAAAKGYALSIALMVSMPAILVGSVATLVVRAHRQRRGE